ncbi:MAG: hypothetical protein ACOY35_02215 [Bacillota bacterium]
MLRVKEDGQEYIISVEIQTHKDREMNMRMLEYSALLHRKYKLPVYPVLINLTGRSSKSSYSWHCGGIKVIDFCYHNIDMNRLNAQDYLYRAPVGLVPFIPLMRYQEPVEELLIQCGRHIEEEILDPVEKANIYVALGTLAQLKLDRQVIMKIIEVSKVENSPFYDTLREKWMAQGMEKGMEKGALKGKVDAILELLLDNLGNIPAEIEQRLSTVTSEQVLRQLLRKAAKVTSLEEFKRTMDELTR